MALTARLKSFFNQGCFTESLMLVMSLGELCSDSMQEGSGVFWFDENTCKVVGAGEPHSCLGSAVLFGTGELYSFLMWVSIFQHK